MTYVGSRTSLDNEHLDVRILAEVWVVFPRPPPPGVEGLHTCSSLDVHVWKYVQHLLPANFVRSARTGLLKLRYRHGLRMNIPRRRMSHAVGHHEES